MTISPIVKLVFDEWINVSTWHTDHPRDEKRFFEFVWTVLHDSRKRPDEKELQELIINTCKGQLTQDYLEEKARKYASLYVTLCDFVDARRMEYSQEDPNADDLSHSCIELNK